MDFLARDLIYDYHKNKAQTNMFCERYFTSGVLQNLKASISFNNKTTTNKAKMKQHG